MGDTLPRRTVIAVRRVFFLLPPRIVFSVRKRRPRCIAFFLIAECSAGFRRRGKIWQRIVSMVDTRFEAIQMIQHFGFKFCIPATIVACALVLVLTPAAAQIGWREAYNLLPDPLPDHRLGFTPVILKDGRVLVIGGEIRGEHHYLPLLARPENEIYDPKTATFMPTGDMASPRCQTAAVVLPNGLSWWWGEPLASTGIGTWHGSLTQKSLRLPKYLTLQPAVSSALVT